jgi:hypothetical protein
VVTCADLLLDQARADIHRALFPERVPKSGGDRDERS